MAAQLGALFSSNDPEVRRSAGSLISQRASTNAFVAGFGNQPICPESCKNEGLIERSFRCAPAPGGPMTTFDCTLDVRKECLGGEGTTSWAEVTVEFADCPGHGSVLYCLCEVNLAGVDTKRNAMRAWTGLSGWLNQNAGLIRCPPGCYKRTGPIKDAACAPKAAVAGAVCVGKKIEWDCIERGRQVNLVYGTGHKRNGGPVTASRDLATVELADRIVGRTNIGERAERVAPLAGIGSAVAAPIENPGAAIQALAGWRPSWLL